MDTDKYIYEINNIYKEKALYKANDKYFLNKKEAAYWSKNMDIAYQKDAEEERRQALVKSLREMDVSASLPEDAAAKLQLLHGDFIIIPVEKLGKK